LTLEWSREPPMTDHLTPSQRAALGIAELQQRFQEITTALTHANIPFAVVGSQATALWIATTDPGATRNPRDTEILIRRENFDSARGCAESLGLMRRRTDSVPYFVDHEYPQSRNVVRYYFANEMLAGDPLPAPSLESLVRLGEAIPVLRLVQHVSWLLTRFRLDDRVDLIDLMRVGPLERWHETALPLQLLNRFNDTWLTFLAETANPSASA
jgi:hypothetical protein